jgi:succinyl-diaminopimelate desuccinylase
MNFTLELTEDLISRASVTPEDGGCLELLGQRLARLGFVCERLDSGPAHFRVSNLWARRAGKPGSATLVFAGHTDVVPTGPLEQWTSAPFVPSHRGGQLYGRGAADMKTSLAAMVVATEEFLQQQPEPRKARPKTVRWSWLKSWPSAVSRSTTASSASPPASSGWAT